MFIDDKMERGFLDEDERVIFYAHFRLKFLVLVRSQVNRERYIFLINLVE